MLRYKREMKDKTSIRWVFWSKIFFLFININIIIIIIIIVVVVVVVRIGDHAPCILDTYFN